MVPPAIMYVVFLEYAQLVEEYAQYANGTDEAYEEEVCTEQCAAQRAVVGKLIAHNLFGYVPSEEQACEQSAEGEEYLSCEEVEEREQWHAEERQSLDSTERERAHGAHTAARQGDDCRCTAAFQLKFLVYPCRSHFME